MSGTGETTTDFAGEERFFRIRLGEERRIEAKLDTGIGEVVRRLSRAVMVTDQLKGIEALAAGVEIHVDDVREVLYQGLLGGGMPAADATKIIRGAIDDCGLWGLLDNAPVALKVLLGERAPEVVTDPLGETQAGTNPATSPSEPTSKPSSASGKSSGSTRVRSKRSQPGSSTAP